MGYSRKVRWLFEFLVLDGAQAGLSWLTILKKRENYRKAFDDFDPSKIARYGESEIRSLLSNPGIVRNRKKVVVRNIGDTHLGCEFAPTEATDKALGFYLYF